MPTDEFGGVLVEPPKTDEFGGVAVEGQPEILSGLVKKQPSYFVRPPKDNFITDPFGGELQLVREPKTAVEGAYNALAKVGGSMVSPLGAAVTAAAPLKPLQPVLAGVFGGLGAKGAGEAAGELLGTPNLTTGQKVEKVGDIAANLVMAAAPVLHAIAPLTARAVEETIKPKEPDALSIRGPAPLPVEELPGDRQAVVQGTPKPEEAPVPQEEKEVLTHAAYQDEEGNVFRGSNHPEILERLGVKGFDTRESRNTPQFGFATNKRSFVPREEATEIGKASGQNLGDFEEGHPLHSDEVESATEANKTIGEQSTGALVPSPEPGETGQLGGGAAEAGEIPETGAGGEKYGVAARVRAERAKAGQVEPVEPGKGISAPDSVDRGRELLRSGADAESALTAFEQNKRLSSDDMALVRAHGEALAAGARTIEDQFGTDSPQYREAFKTLSEWDKRSKAMQTEWHKTGMAQQGETDIDTGSFTGLQRAFKETTGREFTPSQKPKAEKIAKEVRDAQGAQATAKARLVSEIDSGPDMTRAERRAYDAANRTVRLHNIRLAKAENAARVADVELKREVQRVQEEASKRAEKTTTELAKKQAIEGAKAENAARIKAAEQAKSVADVQLKAAQKAQATIDKRARTAAAKLAEAERKAQANPLKRVWDAAKTYLEQGVDDFDDLRNKVSTDLGMKADQVARTLAQKERVKYLADDMWIKQKNARRLQEQAKQWVKAQAIPAWQRAIQSVPKILFGLKVGFHGTVALGTHAPMVAFQPGFWKIYTRDFGRMYKMIAKPAYYEMQVQDLLRRPNYITARRSGLINDPFVFEDFNSPDTAKYFGNLTGMGNRGYSVLKILRQDMFDQMWDKLPKTTRIPEVAEALANGINHATGVVKAKAPKGTNIALFAPRLEASRVMWLAGDPIKAADTFLDWKNATPGDKQFALNQVKEKAWVMGTMASLLALNQGLLTAMGSKQKVNVTDPFSADFLKFKAAGMQMAYGNPMITMTRLPMRLWVGIKNEGKLNKIIYEDENTAKILFDYARSQASPFASLTMDMAFGRDFEGRPLPRAGFGFLPERKTIPKRLRAEGITKAYTWTEFLTEQALPIPAEEAIREVWDKGMGMSKEQQDHYMKAWAILAFMSGTGARVNADTSKEYKKILAAEKLSRDQFGGIPVESTP